MIRYAIHQITENINYRTCSYNDVINDTIGYLSSDSLEKLLCMLITELNDDDINLNYLYVLVDNELKTVIRLS